MKSKTATAANLLSTSAAAEFLGMTEKFLERDRAGPRRIPYILISANRVKYELEALQRFVDQQRRGGPADKR